MDFTREPITESVITPKEGCKLVIRSSKGVGHEEFFVDAVEVVSFGHTFFLRSLEKPKAFLVPATDYEILEVRETRMVLKHVGGDRSIKIGGGKEGSKKGSKAVEKEKEKENEKEKAQEEKVSEEKAEPKRRERKRNYRKKKEREKERAQDDHQPELESAGPLALVELPEPKQPLNLEGEGIGKPVNQQTASTLRALLAPPSELISKSIERYKDNEEFRGVFIPKEEIQDVSVPLEVLDEENPIHLEEPVSETKEKKAGKRKKGESKEAATEKTLPEELVVEEVGVEEVPQPEEVIQE